MAAAKPQSPIQHAALFAAYDTSIAKKGSPDINTGAYRWHSAPHWQPDVPGSVPGRAAS
jgi:hypothetical protein